MSEKPIKRDKRGRFKPGSRGGTAGGKHRLTKFVEAITEPKAKEIVDKIVKQALEGDSQLLSNFQKIFWTARRGDFIKLKDLAGDDPMAALLKATAEGQITDVQAASLARVVETTQLAQEVSEIKQRLEQLNL